MFYRFVVRANFACSPLQRNFRELLR